ncbi:MAG: RNA-binding protein [Candidatus Bathyarchaeota archaeon]|jgi:DNA-binding protein Alba|nr:RNA-binding protein [Candidatus Bathyarchaeota archaeon]
MSADERVYVGSKPILAYVTAVVTAFQRADSVSVMARGRAISSAVDVVEVTKRSFMTNINVDDIAIGTERLGEAGAERNVSTISIKLSRPK